MITTTKDIVITHDFDAPIELVWKAWSESDLIRQWWGPDNFECPSAKIDFREGGTSLVSMASPKLGFPEQFSAWRYTAIVPMERIEYVHNLADADGNAIDPASVGMPGDFPRDMVNVVIFEKLGDRKTRVTVTEKNWPVGNMMEMSKMGMEQCLGKMDKALQNHGDKN